MAELRSLHYVDRSLKSIHAADARVGRCVAPGRGGERRDPRATPQIRLYNHVDTHDTPRPHTTSHVRPGAPHGAHARGGLCGASSPDVPTQAALSLPERDHSFPRDRPRRRVGLRPLPGLAYQSAG